MRLSRASLYAIEALTSMAAQNGNGSVASHITAKAKGIPAGFLLKILRPLVDARILYSVKGPHGGYRLARSLNQIALLDIIEAVDGPLRGKGPSDGGEAMDLDVQLQALCDKGAERLRQQLKKVKLSDLAAK